MQTRPASRTDAGAVIVNIAAGDAETDAAMTLELYLYEKDGVSSAGALQEGELSEEALLESWLGAWTEGTGLLLKPEARQSLQAWFAEMQKELYFS